MRILINILCLFCILDNAFGQDTLHNKIDTSKKTKSYAIRDPIGMLNNLPPLIIIDNKPIEDSLSNHVMQTVNSVDILEITVLKDSSGLGFEKRRDVMIITTKIYAQKQYQNKLSNFSKAYKNYLKTNKNDDRDLFYVLNGEPLERKENGDLIKKLYDIPLKKIKLVSFLDKYYKESFNNNKPIILITTKQ